jgi:hypothetical protein
MRVEIQEPWIGFLSEVDQALFRPMEVHCLGGFVLSVMWGLPRPTGDVDFIDIEPSGACSELLAVAGQGSEISDRYHLYFHQVTIAEYPEAYSSRLVDITPVMFRRLRLKALEVHDLALAKLGRNSPRDRADIEFLAGKGLLDPELLEDRFKKELRPYVLNEARESLTMRLWLDEFFGLD